MKESATKFEHASISGSGTYNWLIAAFINCRLRLGSGPKPRKDPTVPWKQWKTFT